MPDLTMRRVVLLRCVVLFVLLSAVGAQAQGDAEAEPIAPVEFVYKQVVDAEGRPYDLKLHVFYPEGWRAEDARPAIIFYFGGGWNSGRPEQFFPHCRDLAAMGMVAVSADYRVRSRHGTSPIACVEDGRSAIRFLRAHADEMGIDVDRVVAGGGSAGGHVAAATALCDDINDPADDTDISATPNALVLFNPVLDTSRQTGFGGNRLGDDHLRLSPVHRVIEGQPASMVFHGDADRTVPISVARRYSEASAGVDAVCELVEYAGQGHGFFNHPEFRASNDLAIYEDTIARTIAFLRGLEILEPAVQMDTEG